MSTTNTAQGGYDPRDKDHDGHVSTREKLFDKGTFMDKDKNGVDDRDENRDGKVSFKEKVFSKSSDNDDRGGDTEHPSLKEKIMGFFGKSSHTTSTSTTSSSTTTSDASPQTTGSGREPREMNTDEKHSEAMTTDTGRGSGRDLGRESGEKTTTPSQTTTDSGRDFGRDSDRNLNREGEFGGKTTSKTTTDFADSGRDASRDLTKEGGESGEKTTTTGRTDLGRESGQKTTASQTTSGRDLSSEGREARGSGHDLPTGEATTGKEQKGSQEYCIDLRCHDFSPCARHPQMGTHHHHMRGIRTTDAPPDVRVRLNEEQLAVGKKQVQAGGVDIHKRVETHHVEEEVPVRREEIIVERRPIVGAPEDKNIKIDDKDTHFTVPLFREEIVAKKIIVPKEEIVVRKQEFIDKKIVETDVRSEFAEAERAIGSVAPKATTAADAEFHKGSTERSQETTADTGFQKGTMDTSAQKATTGIDSRRGMDTDTRAQKATTGIDSRRDMDTDTGARETTTRTDVEKSTQPVDKSTPDTHKTMEATDTKKSTGTDFQKGAAPSGSIPTDAEARKSIESTDRGDSHKTTTDTDSKQSTSTTSAQKDSKSATGADSPKAATDTDAKTKTHTDTDIGKNALAADKGIPDKETKELPTESQPTSSDAQTAGAHPPRDTSGKTHEHDPKYGASHPTSTVPTDSRGLAKDSTSDKDAPKDTKHSKSTDPDAAESEGRSFKDKLKEKLHIGHRDPAAK